MLDWFAADGSHNIVYTSHNEKQNNDCLLYTSMAGWSLIHRECVNLVCGMRKAASTVLLSLIHILSYEHMLVDNCAMQLVKDPAQFDVILTENMFGDI